MRPNIDKLIYLREHNRLLIRNKSQHDWHISGFMVVFIFHVIRIIETIHHLLDTTMAMTMAFVYICIPDNKVHGVNMGPIWGRQDLGGPRVGSMKKSAIWDVSNGAIIIITITVNCIAITLKIIRCLWICVNRLNPHRNKHTCNHRALILQFFQINASYI